MNFKILASVVVIGLSLSACVKEQSQTQQKPQLPSSITCQNISQIQILKSQKDELNISTEEDFIKSIAYQKLEGLCDKLTQPYSIEVTYTSQLDESIATTNFTATQSKKATFSVQFALRASDREYTATGTASIEITGKKVLDIGEKVEITKQDKRALITKAFDIAYKEAQSRIDSK